MKIDRHTRTKRVLPLLSEERLQIILDQVPAVPLKKAVLEMTVGEFIEATDENYVASLLTERRALKAFGRVKQYRQEMKAVYDYLSRYETSTTSEERRAANGIDFPSAQETMLMECVEFYHLRSTDEAQRLPLSDYLLMKKYKGANALFQRRHQEIISSHYGK